MINLSVAIDPIEVLWLDTSGAKFSFRPRSEQSAFLSIPHKSYLFNQSAMFLWYALMVVISAHLVLHFRRITHHFHHIYCIHNFHHIHHFRLFHTTNHFYRIHLFAIFTISNIFSCYLLFSLYLPLS